MTTNQKRHLESEFALFQTSSIVFSFIQFVKCWRNSLGLNPKGPYLSLEKERENFCAVFTNSIERAHESRKFHVAISATTAKKCTKKRDASAKFFFCQYEPISFLPLSMLPPSSLLQLTIVVMQSFCYRSNVTSHLSSRLVFSLSEIVDKKFIF